MKKKIKIFTKYQKIQNSNGKSIQNFRLIQIFGAFQWSSKTRGHRAKKTMVKSFYPDFCPNLFPNFVKNDTFSIASLVVFGICFGTPCGIDFLDFFGS